MRNDQPLLIEWEQSKGALWCREFEIKDFVEGSIIFYCILVLVGSSARMLFALCFVQFMSDMSYILSDMQVTCEQGWIISE